MLKIITKGTYILAKFKRICYTLKKVASEKVFQVKKVVISKKIWLDRRSRKLLKKKSKVKAKKAAVRKKRSQDSRALPVKFIGDKITLESPTNFSIIENPEDTNRFFGNIYYIIKKNRKRDAVIFLDFSKVQSATVDALMYLVAVLEDIKSAYYKTYNYNVEGDFPLQHDARSLFENSGFLAYVVHPSMEIVPKSKKIQISHGSKIDPGLAKDVCQYVQNKCNLDKIGTVPLYQVLIELMGNTNQHAYAAKTNVKERKRWYLYAEEEKDCVRFVFLDTGAGIAKTVYKKLAEKVRFVSDSEYLVSALKGDFRTQTKKKNRSKGLKQISECSKSGILEEVTIIANKGFCRISGENNNDNYDAKELDCYIKGSLFSWIIKKREGCA